MGRFISMRLVSANIRIALLLSFAAAGWAQQSFVPTVISTPGSPSQVLFGTYHGVLVRSSDLGTTWVPIYVSQAGLPQPPVQGFAIDSNNPNILYLATTIAAGAFWKITDGGATWTKANSGLPTAGAGVDYFKYILDGSPFLYIKAGSQFFESTDQGANWILDSNLPGSAGTMAIADARRAWMYYVEPSTLAVSFSADEGHTWQQLGTIPANLQNAVIQGMSVLYFNPSDIFIDLQGQGPYASFDGGKTFTDATVAGLGDFTQIVSYTTGPTYAITPNYVGTFRSTDSAQTWQSFGSTGDRYGVTAVDPSVRTTVYGVKTAFGSATQTALVTSINADMGMNWTIIPATITPTIAKPAAGFNITLEQGAPYSVAFTVQTSEDPAWQLPVTVKTSGEPWIQVGAASGSTPLPNSITINTAGLAAGNYTSTLLIGAPASNNKLVSIPVMLTVRAAGSIGPGYLVSTVAGNGQASVTGTSGTATKLGIGAAKALAFDAFGNVLISSGSYLWQLSSGTTLTVLAGNGLNASNGDGSDPLSASIADPDAIALDTQGTIYFTEYKPERVRKLFGSTINTYLDLTKSQYNQTVTVGSHSLLLDSSNRLLLTGPAGLLRFNGPQLQVLAPYAFSDPYGTAMDASGNIYISDRALHQIFKVSFTPIGAVSAVSVVAGIAGLAGFSGDGGPATQATLNTPEGIAFDPQGTLYIADSANHRIRTITPDGTIRTVAGSGVPGFAGDGQTADFASFLNPTGVLVDGQGNVYVADTGNNRVRMLVFQGTPTPKPAALVNGPSSAAKLSPGGVFVLYGSALAPPGTTAAAASVAWPKSLAGVSITINGVLAPLYYVSPSQINGQIPFETALGTATAVITTNGSLPAQITFPVVAAEPAILLNGVQALAVNQDQVTLNSPATPAARGDIETLYLTGIGQTNPPASTGLPAPSQSPFAMVNYTYQITVNGQQTKVYYLGLAPGWTGLVQADFQIPSGLANGSYPVVVMVNGESSVPAQISVY